MTTTNDAPAPAIGSAAVILPVAEGTARTGTVLDWSASPAGLVATARIALPPSDVADLAGQRVWARVEAVDGGVSVLEAVAGTDPRGTELTLTGVLSLSHERRRAAARTGTAAPAQVRAGTTDASVRLVDLSRTGARLELPRGELASALDAAARVEVEVSDVGSERVTATAEVVRVDAGRGEFAVRFTDLSEEDADRIERVVLTELSAQHPATR